MYLVLIDSRVRDVLSIVSSLTTDTEYITFDFFADNIQSIQDKITKQYYSVAIIQHNYLLDEYRLVVDSSDAIIYNLETTDPGLNTWQQYIDFLHWLKNERGVAYVDLMACDLWANPGWRYMIETVRSTRGIYLRASIDITGAGGNFILESDNFNTIGVYFTADILNYKYAFFTQAFFDGLFNPTFNYTPYTLPDTNLAKVSTRYQALLGANSPTTYTTVKQVVSSASSSAILLSNGNVFVVGSNSTSLLMPSGIVTQSDLVNVSKIIAGANNFIVIKTNGSIVCWGKGADGADVNVSDTWNTGLNAVRSQLTNVVDVVVNYGTAFAALNSDGSVVTWGKMQYGGDKTTAATYLSSGITNIYASVQSLFALKNDGTVVRWGNGTPIYTTSSFTNSKPIVDMIVEPFSGVPLMVRKNGNLSELVIFSTNTVYYTLPTGVTILRKLANPKGYSYNFFILFSNNTLGTLVGATWTLYTNVTDVAVSGGGGSGSYAYIQNGAVVVGGTSSTGGSLTDTTFGLKSGANLTNPVRLVSSQSSIGCIKSDNTFVWWGRIDSAAIYNSATFPADSTQTTLYNAYNGLSISNIYQSLRGYAIVKQDGSIAMLGPNSANNVNSTTNYGTKDASTNVYFELAGTVGFIALEIPYSPSVSPTSINMFESSVVSYYVSNPDKMAYIGRKYNLYNASGTLIDTFIPTKDTHTYVFSNVFIKPFGLQTLTIKDESTISYTVDTFSLNVLYVHPCFLEGSKILCLDPESDQEVYIPVETLREGDLVKTSNNGYKAIFHIGRKTIENPADDPNPRNRLYRFRKSQIPWMTEDLCITGEHCTLHRKLYPGFDENPDGLCEEKLRINAHIPTEEECWAFEETVREHMGDIYITEYQYRVPACIDKRSVPYDGDGPATIWHFALENHNIYHNYGVWANGLLVESCSIQYLTELAGMELV